MVTPQVKQGVGVELKVVLPAVVAAQHQLLVRDRGDTTAVRRSSTDEGQLGYFVIWGKPNKEESEEYHAERRPN
jgi:hypothetical protein